MRGSRTPIGTRRIGLSSIDPGIDAWPRPSIMAAHWDRDGPTSDVQSPTRPRFCAGGYTSRLQGGPVSLLEHASDAIALAGPPAEAWRRRIGEVTDGQIDSLVQASPRLSVVRRTFVSEAEPENPVDGDAVLVVHDASEARLGWVPRPLLPLLRDIDGPTATVLRVNPASLGFHYRLLVRLTGRWTSPRLPFDGEQWEL